MQAERRLQRALDQAVTNSNAELGLGPHGPIIGALESAAQRLDTPLNASARFVARVDGSGRLVDLAVADVTADRAAWDRVRRAAWEALSGTRLTSSAGTRGLVLQIAVSSREQLPSGADPGLTVTVAGVKVKRGKGKRSSRIDIMKPELKIENVEVPGPGGESVRLPMIRAGVTALNLGLDPADFGARPSRMVHAHVISVEAQ